MATGTGPFQADEVLSKVLHVPGTSQDAVPWTVQQESAYYSTKLGSLTTAGSGSGTTHSAFTGLGGFRSVDVYVRVNTGTGTSPALDLFVDSRLDGTTWINLAHLTQMTASGDVMVRFSRYVATAVETSAIRGDAAAGAIRNVGWGDDLRLRSEIGGTTVSFTYAGWLNANG